ncbi:hypothetical protein M0802_012291 [Mischocyttarus mexicanus]|nr:hypothetical protein M0802_012291 [Mischocyttarus mexicanus]
MQIRIDQQNNRTDDDVELFGNRNNKQPRALQGNNEPSNRNKRAGSKGLVKVHFERVRIVHRLIGRFMEWYRCVFTSDSFQLKSTGILVVVVVVMEVMEVVLVVVLGAHSFDDAQLRGAVR